MPTSKITDGRFGYLRLPELNTLGSDGQSLGAAYTSSVRGALLRMEQSPLCGWIIDLRGNGGGNMWPMLWGLDPLLGKPPFGFFVLPDGTKQAWIRSMGNIFPSAEALPPSPPAFEIKQSLCPRRHFDRAAHSQFR
nr:S41 family peptidase [Sphingomonas sp. H160509]